jgi:predicted CoA-binding protein
MSDWRSHLLTEPDDYRELVRGLRRVAVLGIKTEAEAAQPAFYVAEYLANAGIEVVPVPVYYPNATTILGRPVVRRVVDAGPVDLVNVFRRPRDVAGHLEDLLAAKPPAVWLQLGIRNDEVAEALAKAGIDVVQDRCLLVEHRRFA